jgi:hypothetical protein
VLFFQNCIIQYIYIFSVKSVKKKTVPAHCVIFSQFIILTCSGICWRWALAASEDGRAINLELQALPYSGATLKGNPAFSKDNLAVVILTSFPVSSESFDGGRAAGPIPVFFSANPGETLEKLKVSASLAHQLCQAMATRFLSTEALSAVEAWELNGLPREGKACSPFLRAWRDVEPPVSKKQRTADPVTSCAADTAGSCNIYKYKNSISQDRLYIYAYPGLILRT